MSLKLYVVIALNHGFEKIHLDAKGDKNEADKFIGSKVFKRYEFAGDFKGNLNLANNEALVYASKEGVIAYGTNMVLDLIFDEEKLQMLANSYAKLMAIIYNDQCYTDVFTFYENGSHVRTVADLDGWDQEEVILKGDMLLEEIEALKSSRLDDVSDAELVTKFDVEGREYTVDSRIPYPGAGLAISKRVVDFDIEWQPMEKGTIYRSRPFWRFW